MRRFRYRTSALTGPWRDTVEEAIGDAAKAKQAEADEFAPDGVRWIVPGRIEEVNNQSLPTRARN